MSTWKRLWAEGVFGGWTPEWEGEPPEVREWDEVAAEVDQHAAVVEARRVVNPNGKAVHPILGNKETGASC